MPITLDHVFVCTAPDAPAAEALVAAGFTEGAPNVHPGQGTRCRRFFFHDAYLELLWVHDAHEARSALTAPTRLWERWQGRDDGRTAPFGLCVRAPAGEPLPFATWGYRPGYLPPDLAIPVAVDDAAPTEPMVFALPFGTRPDALPPERAQPLVHAAGVRETTRVVVAGPPPRPGGALAALAAAGVVACAPAARPLLTLGLDGERRGRVLDLRPGMPLVLRW
jgi:hypothetical protein